MGLCKEKGCNGVLKYLGATVGGTKLYGCLICKRVYYEDKKR